MRFRTEPNEKVERGLLMPPRRKGDCSRSMRSLVLPGGRVHNLNRARNTCDRCNHDCERWRRRSEASLLTSLIFLFYSMRFPYGSGNHKYTLRPLKLLHPARGGFG